MTTQICVYGSGECEQLGLPFGDDDLREVKRARVLEFFAKIPVVKLVCGGMHTLVLDQSGRVYSWGCNDEGALGRDGPESLPQLITLPAPVNNITCGDSHSIVYNTQANQMFTWGLYRNSASGATYKPVKDPMQFGIGLFDQKSKEKLKKVVSGSHHSLALSESGKVYAWGDPESGKIGRNLRSRNRNRQALHIESIGTNKACDVFCGNHTSFYADAQGALYAWGLNNHGQLGVGHKKNICVPEKVVDLVNVKEVAGGEHHTLCVTNDMKVYCWGRNDEGQGGLGDLYGDYQKKKREQQQKDQSINVAEQQGKPQSRESQYTEEDLEGIYYFEKPKFVESLKDVDRVYAGSNYNYTLSYSTNEVYAWGMGYNYVLGTRDEENEFFPKLVHPKMYLESAVRDVGAGSQHVVVLIGDKIELKIDQTEWTTEKVQENLKSSDDVQMRLEDQEEENKQQKPKTGKNSKKLDVVPGRRQQQSQKKQQSQKSGNNSKSQPKKLKSSTQKKFDEQDEPSNDKSKKKNPKTGGGASKSVQPSKSRTKKSSLKVSKNTSKQTKNQEQQKSKIQPTSSKTRSKKAPTDKNLHISNATTSKPKVSAKRTRTEFEEGQSDLNGRKTANDIQLEKLSKPKKKIKLTKE